MLPTSKPMRWLTITVAGFAAIALVLGVAFVWAIDGLVKRAIETVGPQMTGTRFAVEDVEIRLFAGYSQLRGVEIANPEGYPEPFAMRVDQASVDLHPGTLAAQKLEIESIVITGPQLSFHGGATSNNLSAIARNFAKYVEDQRESGRFDQKLQVNHFLITDAKVQLRLALLGGHPILLQLPEVEIRDLGTHPEGISPAEFGEHVIRAITDAIWREIRSQHLNQYSTGTTPLPEETTTADYSASQ